MSVRNTTIKALAQAGANNLAESWFNKGYEAHDRGEAFDADNFPEWKEGWKSAAASADFLVVAKFTPAELELLAEALNYRIQQGDFSKSLKTHFNTEAHKIALNHLADKVVSMQEADQRVEEYT